MYCRKCGERIKDGTKFCIACGTLVSDKGLPEVPYTAGENNHIPFKKLAVGIGAATVGGIIIIAAGLFLFGNSYVMIPDEPETAVREAESIGSQTPDAGEAMEDEPETVITTGFVAQNDELYYYDANGELVTGWFVDGSSRYCARQAAENGSLYRSGEYVIDGIRYFFDEDGVCIGDENACAEEDARLLKSADSGKLGSLMLTIAHVYIGEGNTRHWPKTSEEVQSNINNLLGAEKEGIDSFFANETPAAAALDYVNENQPDGVEYGWGLTEEQIEYLVYSVCGKQLDLDLNSYESLTDAGPYFQFGGAAGDLTWSELDHFSVERVDANTWKVRADVYYGIYESFFHGELVAAICFDVVRNPDSCFDGYSLTRAEVDLAEHVDAWKYMYLDYIDHNYNEGKLYQLFYMDDDAIPEMLVWDSYAGEAVIITADNDRETLCYSEVFELLGTQYSIYYLERQNFVNVEQWAISGMMFGGCDNSVYRIMDGAVCQADVGHYEYQNIYDESYDNYIGMIETYWWNEQELPAEAYYDKIHQDEVKDLDFRNGMTYDQMSGMFFY